MASSIRRSTRSRSNLSVKFADDLDFNEPMLEDDQSDDNDEMNQLPVARTGAEQQRHIRETDYADSGNRKRQGRPAKRDHDTDWHVEDNFLNITPLDVTLRSQGNPSVYEFSESSNKKSSNSIQTNISRDSTKIRRDEKHLCPYCNYCTGKKYLLQRHLKSHSTERPHKCNYCSNTFKTTAQLQNHVNTHLGIKPFQCKFCEYKFTTSGELIRHVRYKHTMEKPHKCEQCGYATVELSKLRRHIRTHTGEKPYSCPHCSYCSPDTFKLKRHLRVHTGERPYQCTICKFCFTQSNSLKAHMITHQANAQKFHCTYCPTVLTRKADLKQHMIKKHANDENFLTCLQCDQEFADPHELNEHKQLQHANNHINTTRTQLNCTLCTFKTFSQSTFDEHIDSQHRDNRTYQCTECGLMYATRGDLRQHVIKVHNYGVDVNKQTGGLSIQPRSSSSISKNSQRSLSPATKQIITRHHRIEPFDVDEMKTTTIEENKPNSEEEQMAIIQFRNQQHKSEQSRLVIKIERDADDDFETADDFLSNKPTPRNRRSSKKESENGDAFVQTIEDDESLIDDNEQIDVIFKYRSSTQR